MHSAMRMIQGDTKLPNSLPDWFPKELADMAVKYIKLEIEEESDSPKERTDALKDELRLFSYK